MYNAIVCAIAAVMLASTAVVAKPRTSVTPMVRPGSSIAVNWSAQKKGKGRLAKPPPCDRRSCGGMIA